MARRRRVRRSRGADPRAARTTAVTEEAGGPPPPPLPAGPPPREWWPWFLLLLLLVVGGIIAFLVFRDNGSNHKTTVVVTSQPGTLVPRVVGMTQTLAITKLTSKGFQPTVTRRPSARPSGIVVSQAPPAGRRIVAGSAVAIVVSTGKPEVTVPKVTGLATAAAEQRLAAAKLKSSTTEAFADRPKGTVVSQDPKEGERVARGTEVTLIVSKGPKRVTVPDVVGLSSAEAQAALKKAGFTYTIVLVPSGESRGTVVAQNPRGGSRAQFGSSARLNVSGGPSNTTATTSTSTSTSTALATARVPAVVGLNQRVAARRLQAAGLKSRVVYVVSRKPAGRVVAQAPAAGRTVARGSRVRINVSEGPNPKALATVPNVLGQDEQTATATLRAAGFVVIAFNESTSDPSQDGIVLDEQPTGGSRAPTGSVVTIYVGRVSG